MNNKDLIALILCVTFGLAILTIITGMVLRPELIQDKGRDAVENLLFTTVGIVGGWLMGSKYEPPPKEP